MSSSSGSTPRPRLSEWELTWAFVVGGGILLLMLAFGLNAIRGPSADSSTFASMLIMGLLLLVGGTICWMIQLRPWRKFDDLSIPLYTGHHDTPDTHAAVDHAAHTAPVESLEPAHLPAAYAEPPVMPPVMMDPIAAFTPEAAPVNAPMVAMPSHADNFERIRGIGPKIASALIGAGIFTFAELAKRPPAELEAIVHGASVRLIGSAATWPAQAQLAANADWDGLAKYQAEQIDHSE